MKTEQTKKALNNIRRLTIKAPFKWLPQIVLILGALNLLLFILMLVMGDFAFSAFFAISAIIYLTFGFFILKGSKTAVKILFYLMLFDTVYLLSKGNFSAIIGLRLVLIFALYMKMMEFKLEKKMEGK
jgi:signal transduction histidine kinase